MCICETRVAGNAEVMGAILKVPFSLERLLLEGCIKGDIGSPPACPSEVGKSEVLGGSRAPSGGGIGLGRGAFGREHAENNRRLRRSQVPCFHIQRYK